MPLLDRDELALLMAMSRDDLSGHTHLSANLETTENRLTNSVVRAALCAKTYPLCLYSLREAKAGRADTAIDTWERAFFSQWLPARTRLHNREQQIRILLDENGFHYAFLRGMTLGDRYYKHPLLRVSGDTDLLVPADKREEVIFLLRDNGYEPIHPTHYQNALAAHASQLELRHKVTGCTLDLNWGLCGNGNHGILSPPMDEVWDHSSKVKHGECRLAPEDELLDLIRHAAVGHSFDAATTIRCCSDVYAFLRGVGDQIDWDRFERMAVATEAIVTCQLFWMFYADYYTSEVPSAHNAVSTRLWARGLPRVVLFRTQRWVERDNGLLQANVESFFRFATASSARDLLKRVVTILLPSYDVSVLLNSAHTDSGPVLGRLRVWVKLLPTFPGGALGVAASFVALVRGSLGGRYPNKSASRASDGFDGRFHGGGNVPE